jgi:hypothetical protein
MLSNPHSCINEYVAEKCCWAIANVVDSNDDNRVKYGAVAGSMDMLDDLLKAQGIKPTGISGMTTSCRSIAELCRSNPSNLADDLQNCLSDFPPQLQWLFL